MVGSAGVDVPVGTVGLLQGHCVERMDQGLLIPRRWGRRGDEVCLLGRTAEDAGRVLPWRWVGRRTTRWRGDRARP